jgi:hypothetical protein
MKTTRPSANAMAPTQASGLIRSAVWPGGEWGGVPAPPDGHRSSSRTGAGPAGGGGEWGGAWGGEMGPPG